MLTKEAYAFYEAGAAVAAVHCRLRVRSVSISAARGKTDIAFPRDGLKVRITLWLTGLAAEKKGVGETDPFRRMKNRQRIRGELDAWKATHKELDGEAEKAAQSMLNQAQDRANAICSGLFPAIQRVAAKLLELEMVEGDEVEKIVAEFRQEQGAARALPSEPCD